MQDFKSTNIPQKPVATTLITYPNRPIAYSIRRILCPKGPQYSESNDINR